MVTGASTGIGAATARELAKRGFHVLAGVRRDADADAIRSANIEPRQLDITNEAEIAIANNSSGNARKMSMIRLMTASTAPP